MGADAFSLLHAGVQKAIWSMGWKELHAIQVAAIEAILGEQGHVLIAAQTAGGKTEAAFLPIISKLAANPQPSVQALYVGPLKALINDQFARLEILCEQLDIPVHRWHGDVPGTRKKRLRDDPGGILLITPESLESNFINFGNQVARIYKNIEFVVIDELHSFLASVRGIHLLSLLARLSAATARRPRLVGLSATLGDLTSACRFLEPDDPSTVRIINDASATREVRFGMKAYLQRDHPEGTDSRRLTPHEIADLAEQIEENDLGATQPLATKLSEPPIPRTEVRPADELDEIADDVLRAFASSTNLIFGNSKASIELLADRLHERVRLERWPADPFIVHHGSLSKDLREEGEEILKSGRPTTALCSSTLEMGIDIGAVRAVGQLDVPWSVASTVQRLGRSGRRAGDAAIMRMYVRDDSPHRKSTLTSLLFPNLLRAVAITRLMVNKWLEPLDSDRLHLSTLVHQILSWLRQTGGTSAAMLYTALIAEGPFRNVNAEQFETLLRCLAANDLIEQMPEGELILALTGERVTAAADFYAAFQGTEEYTVRHDGEQIGKLQSSLLPPIGENIILAGRRWRVDEIVPATLCVFVSPSRGGKAPVFRGARGDVHTRVSQEMRTVLFTVEEPPYLDVSGKMLLASARRVASLSGLTRCDVLIRPSAVQWFPWLGTRGLVTLSLCAATAGIAHEADALSITYHTSPEGFREHIRSVESRHFTALELASRMPVKIFEKFDGALSDDLLDLANARDRLDLDAAVEAAQTALRHLP